MLKILQNFSTLKSEMKKTPDRPNTGDVYNIGGYALSLISAFILFWILTRFAGGRDRL